MPDSSPASNGSGRVRLLVLAGVASVVAIVLVVLMLIDDGMASSSWPMIVAVGAIIAAALALLGWWRHRPSGLTSLHDRDQFDS